MSDEDCLIATCQRFDREMYNMTGEFWFYSIILKINLYSSEVEWETPMDSTSFASIRSNVNEIIDSHDGDGYIWVGNGINSQRTTSIVFGKISKDGEMLWRHEIYDNYLPTNLEPSDVIATSDGYYMLTGRRSDLVDNDGFDTRVQLIMMKFDEDGNVVTLLTDTEEPETSLPLSIIPNPAQENVQISTGIIEEKVIYITDISGQLVHKDTCISADCHIDIASLVEGTYIILVSDENGEMLGKEKLVMQR